MSHAALSFLSSLVLLAAGSQAAAEPAKRSRLALVSADGDYEVELGLRVQPFYVLSRSTDPVDYRNQLEIRRARLTLEGHVHSPKLRYKFQTDFGRGAVTLKDFRVDGRLARSLWLRAGQYKRPFSRQHITSSGRLALPGRAITDPAFGAGRDIGIALHNGYEQTPGFEWTIGVFNGFTADEPELVGDIEIDRLTGEVEIAGGGFTNVPAAFKPALIARVGINRNGLRGYSEADLEGGGLRYGIGASAWLEADYDDDQASSQKLQLDYLVKLAGFASSGGIYAMMEQNGPDVGEQQFSLLGYFVQASYLAVPARFAIAGRYAVVSDWITTSPTARDGRELAVGGTYFGHGHDAKVMGAVRFLRVGEAGYTDAVVVEVGANIGF